MSVGVDVGRPATRQRGAELWKARSVVEWRQFAEQGFVLGAVPQVDLLGRVQARAVHLDRRLQRTERLIIEGVVATVPHEHRHLAYVEQRRRLAPSPPSAQ